jgi:hypothetical protein
MAQTTSARKSLYDFDQPFNFDETIGREACVYVDDKNGRLYLSSETARKLGHNDGFPFSLHVAFKDGNIGLTKPTENVWADKRPARFDKRRYASARTFIKKLNVPGGKYVYDSYGNNWFVFRPEKDVRP